MHGAEPLFLGKSVVDSVLSVSTCSRNAPALAGSILTWPGFPFLLHWLSNLHFESGTVSFVQPNERDKLTLELNTDVQKSIQGLARDDVLKRGPGFADVD
jgi:hypothetical protein